MFFDDRLATVLRQRAQSDSMRRTQFRQLLDLLGSQAKGAHKAARDPSLVAAAWMRMNKLAEMLPAKDRARLVAEPGWRLRNPELVAHLADFEPDVASAALSRAKLSGDDWTALIPRLPVRARGFLRLRRDLPTEVVAMLDQLGIFDRGLPNPEALTEQTDQPEKVNSEGMPVFGDDPPLDLQTSDELPGANIPIEDLPSDPLVGSPIDPATEDDADQDNASPLPLRPIFFPKDKSASEKTEGSSEETQYAPEPFTIDELRQIAEEPLGIDEQSIGEEPEEESLDSATRAFETLDEGLGEEDLGEEREEDPREESAADDTAFLTETLPGEELRGTDTPAQGLRSESSGHSEISALVERISTFQRAREDGSREAPERDEAYGQDDRLMPRLPLGEDDRERVRLVRGFGFAADAAGRIEWAEEEAAAMVIGARLVTPSQLHTGDASGALTDAFNQRQPIKALPLTLQGAPAIAGQWVVDAQPRFSQIGGFSGYAGRMRRPIEATATDSSPAQREADRIRQLLHELRTPVTAVQGYAEVIQQQLFGSAPHEYRALAAAIASDAARILSGFEELDRLAKLETGMVDIDTGQADIAALTTRIVQQLSQVLDARMAGIELRIQSSEGLVTAIDNDSAEGLMWRLLASLGGGCGAGEVLKARLSANGEMIRMHCDLPMQLLGEDDLFAADARPLGTAISPGLFGSGFALRLARAEARAAAGDLVREWDGIVLTLPKAVDIQEEKSSNFVAS